MTAGEIDDCYHVAVGGRRLTAANRRDAPAGVIHTAAERARGRKRHCRYQPACRSLALHGSGAIRS
jgi:hypothetical protein